MIIVKNRELLIPNNERYIGTTYDTDTENRVFQVPRYSQRGVDLAALTFRLDIQYANESYDTIVLDKEIGEAFVILIWRITSSTLQVPGTMYIGLRAVDNEATVKWSSFSAAMYVERHLNTPGNYGGDLTEIEQMEQDHQYMKGVVNELKEHIDYTFESEAWAVGKRNGVDVPSTDETYHNNSKYYKEVSDSHRKTAERYANGKEDGTDVTSGVGYHDNSKYYKELADDHRKTAEAYAKGTVDGTDVASGQTGYHDNAKYYKEQVQASANQIATNATNIAAQTARIDGFVALEDGSTTGDAELQDIRVGQDGVTYNSAGTAVRTQFSNVKSHLELTSGNEIVEFQSGYIPITAAGSTVSLTPTPSNDGICAIAAVTPNETVHLRTRGGGTSAGGARAYAWIDAELKVLLRSDSQVTYENLTLQAPMNAAYIVVNHVFLNATFAPYLIIGQYDYKKIADLNEFASFEFDANGVPTQHIAASDFTSNVIYNVDGTSTVYGSTWKSTEFIPCCGANISYKAHAYKSGVTNLAYVAFFDIDRKMTHCLKSSDVAGDGTNQSVTGTATSQTGDYYVRVITHTTSTPTAYLDVEASGIYPSVASMPGVEPRLSAIENEIGTDGTTIYYADFDSQDILRENGTFNNYGSVWKSTDYINCVGVSDISYKATAFNGQGVNKVAYVAFFDAAYNIVSMLKSSDIGANRDVTGTVQVPDGAIYVRVVGSSATCYLSFNTSGLRQFDAFKSSDLHVLCIGDSLTRGVINSDTDIIAESYPYWVGKILSSTVSNAGFPGGQPQTWWTRKGNYDQPTPSTDLVLIMFGTNGGLDVNTLSTDVEPYSDYNDYADTGVGCMCKIIEWVMEETTNHAQIILMTPPHSTFSNAQETRVVQSEATIRAIAKRYALPVIDVLNECGMNIYNGSTFRPSDGCHFNAKGYHKLGSFVAHKVASMYSTFDNTETGTIIS